MIPVLRLCTALFLALACIPPVGWLTLVCADFVGLDDCLSPRPGWIMYACVSALALALPPALHSWPDLSRSPRELIREGLRSVLFSFALFALAFLGGAKPFFVWLNIPQPLTAGVAANLSLSFSCPLALMSYWMIRWLLPRPAPDADVPASMRRFGWLALILPALAAIQPWITGGPSILFPSSLALVCGSWVLLSLRLALRDHGNVGFVPAWGGMCLLCAFNLGITFPYVPVLDKIFCAILLLTAVWSCICLLHRDSRLWLC